MGIFPPVGALFALDLNGGEESDLAGFDEIASGFGRLTMAGANSVLKPPVEKPASPLGPLSPRPKGPGHVGLLKFGLGHTMRQLFGR
jgi:hypothetical protein